MLTAAPPLLVSRCLDLLMRHQVAAVHHAMVEPSLLRQLHSAGKQGYGWTADQPHMMRRLLDVGVDAIVTSHPQRSGLLILLPCPSYSNPAPLFGFPAWWCLPARPFCSRPCSSRLS